MQVSVRSLLGVGSIPGHRTSATRFMERSGVPLKKQSGPGGDADYVAFSDLPAPERLAYLRRELENLRLDPGDYDDAAHAILAEAPRRSRERAERRAEIARAIMSLKAQGARECEWMTTIRERFGGKGTSKASLNRLLKAVEGVDPINFAPALLDNYKDTAKRADMSDEAWRFFLTSIRDAAPDWPLKEAWRRVRDAGGELGWAVPSYPTFYRRWLALDEAQRLHARHGAGETTERLAQPAHRDKTAILPLQWVSLDGRTQDFWVDWGDGAPSRPVMLALVDIASNMIIGWELGRSENAVGTVRVIKRVCERFGIFDRLYTDNGSAFAGHLVAGGNVHRFRNGEAKGLQPPGICKHMGIDLTFALPANAQAKIAERAFAAISRIIDDGPEFRGAHAGHAPGARPSTEVKPIPVDQAKAVLTREIGRYNRETGRRGQGARGRSYEQMFREGLAQRVAEGRPVRKATARQLYLSGLHWKSVAVNRHGQVTVSGWIYGGPDTQQALLPYHGGGQRIIFGRDPDDLSAPGIAYDDDGNLICEGVAAIRRGAYDSADGIRAAARNRKAARAAAKAAEAANKYQTDAEYDRAVAALVAASGASDPSPPPQPKVVGGRFGGPFRDEKPTSVARTTIGFDSRKALREYLDSDPAKREKSA